MGLPKEVQNEIHRVLNYPELYVIEECPMSPDKFKISRKAGVGLYSRSRRKLIIDCVCQEIEELGADSFRIAIYPR